MSAPGIGLQLRIDIDLDADATELELATVQLRRELLALDLDACERTHVAAGDGIRVDVHVFIEGGGIAEGDADAVMLAEGTVDPPPSSC